MLSVLFRIRITPLVSSNSYYMFDQLGGRRGRDRMVFDITTSCVISTYHPWRDVPDTTLCDIVWQ